VAKNVDAACSRYERALLRGRCSRRADGNVAEQVARYRERYAVVAEEDALIRDVLMEFSLPLTAYLGCANLARHLARLGRKYTQTTLRNVTREAVYGPLGLGLERQVIDRLCQAVLGFGLTELDTVL
jgi:hypothetical protein